MQRSSFYTILASAVFAALGYSSASAQQDAFSISIDHLSVKEHWYSYKDNCGSGYESSGDDTLFYQYSQDCHFDSVCHYPNGQTSYIDSNYSVTIHYDKANCRFVSLHFNYRKTTETYIKMQRQLSFSLEQVPAIETVTAYTIDLQGSELENLKLALTDYTSEGPSHGATDPTHSYESLTALSIVNNSASVKISLSKQHVLAVAVDQPHTLSVYPSVANSTIYITSPDEQISKPLVVLDQMGRAVLSRQVEKSFTSVDVSSLTTGAYWIKVGAEVKKFIIAR